MSFSLSRAAVTVVAVIALAACGSNSSNTSNTSTSNATSAAATPPAMMSSMAKQEPIPKDLHCSDAIVWVNLSSKAYHLPDDPYYGRTKHGEYMCRSDAEAKGYHLSGMPHGHTGSHMSATPEPAST